jgi:hypothetical protein
MAVPTREVYGEVTAPDGVTGVRGYVVATPVVADGHGGFLRVPFIRDTTDLSSPLLVGQGSADFGDSVEDVIRAREAWVPGTWRQPVFPTPGVPGPMGQMRASFGGSPDDVVRRRSAGDVVVSGDLTTWRMTLVVTDSPDTDPTGFGWLIQVHTEDGAVVTQRVIEVPGASSVPIFFNSAVMADPSAPLFGSAISRAEFDALSEQVTTGAAGAVTAQHLAEAAAATATDKAQDAEAAFTATTAQAGGAAAAATSAGQAAAAAATSAGAAETSANAAGASAGSANTAASVASVAATASVTARTGAESARDLALTYASDAQTRATAAAQAQHDAESARDTAVAAQEAVEAFDVVGTINATTDARDEAVSAAQSAATSAATATTQAGLSQAARAAAEAASVAAQSSEAEAEVAADGASTSAATAATSRDTSISARDAAVTARAAAEAARNQAVSARDDVTTGLAAKANTADLAPVATAGTYASLTGKPTLGTAAAQNTTAFEAAGAVQAAITAEQSARDSAISSAIAALVNMAPSTLDTLAEIATRLAQDESAAASILAALDAHKADTANPHQVTKTQVGLGQADNTSDVNKPVSTAQAAAIATKADATALSAHTGDLANPHQVTKAQVGLGNADNTSDANKPVSTATQTALNGKVPTARSVIAGTGLSGGGDLSADVTINMSLATVAPSALGATAQVGTATVAARRDHVHPYPTAAQVGAAATVHTHDGADITTGTVAPARLGTGTRDGTRFLRDDGVYAAVSIPAALTVQDENANVSTAVSQIDFQGAGVTVTPGTGEVIVTIPGGGGGGPSGRSAEFYVNGTISVGTGATRWYNDTGATLTIVGVRATVVGSPTGSALIVDVNRNGTTVFTTQANRPTIAASGTTSGKVVPDVVSVADGQYLTVDVDQVGSTVPGADLQVQITFG